MRFAPAVLSLDVPQSTTENGCLGAGRAHQRDKRNIVHQAADRLENGEMRHERQFRLSPPFQRTTRRPA